MTALLPAQRRADKFAALVDASSASDAGEPYASLLEVVGTLCTASAVPPVPRADYVAALRARLMAEADTALVPTDRKLVLAQRGTTAGRRQSRFAAAAAGLVLVGASTGVSLAAQSSLPGGSLYPVKRGVERVSVAISFTDAARGRNLLHRADTRLDEVDALLADGVDARVPGTLRSFTDSAGSGADLLFSDYQGGGDNASITSVHDFASAAMGRLTDLASSAPASLQPDFADAAQLLADLDQQAIVLCSTCGAHKPLSVPDGLDLASFATSLDSLLGTTSTDDLGRAASSVGPASTTSSVGPAPQQPSATETSGIVVPPLDGILGGGTPAPGATATTGSGLGGLLHLPAAGTGGPRLPGVTKKITRQAKGTVGGTVGGTVKGALGGVTGSVLKH